MPFGTDIATGNFVDFTKTAVLVMAAENSTTVDIQGGNHNLTDVAFDQGECQLYTDVHKGTTFTADKPIQVQILIGTTSSYEVRGISGVPREKWSNDYWAPIEVSGPVDIFLYNPAVEGSINVYYENSSTSGNVQIDADETISLLNEGVTNINEGMHVYTSNANDDFWGVVSVDTQSATRDWAFDLIPAGYITTDYRVGWAPGSGANPPVTITNAIYAMALENDTDIFIDFDGDGTIDQSFNGGNTLNQFDVVLIADTGDHDASGARIWTNDKQIALSYGEISGNNSFEGGTTPSGPPALDLGYTILPMPIEWVQPVIQVTTSDDQGENPVVAVGENVEFTIRLDAHDYNLTSVNLEANLDVCWEYEDDSTTITHYNSTGGVKWTVSGNAADPATITGTPDPGYILSWPLDNYDGEYNGGVDADEWVILSFEAYPTACSLEGENEIVSETEGTYNSQNFNAQDSEFVTLDGPPGEFGDEPVPVMLSSFTAEFDEVPIISWETQSEMQNLGWNIYRSEEETGFETGDYIQINNGIISGEGTTSEPTYYVYEDNENFESEVTYWYLLESLSFSGGTENYGPISLTIPTGTSNDLPPVIIGLHNNYPNPFNPSTSITFAVKKASHAKLTVLNIKGQKVKTLFNDYISEENTNKAIATTWNGTDSSNIKVASGIYFYKLEAEKKTTIKKMILMK